MNDLSPISVLFQNGYRIFREKAAVLYSISLVVFAVTFFSPLIIAVLSGLGISKVLSGLLTLLLFVIIIYVSIWSQVALLSTLVYQLSSAKEAFEKNKDQVGQYFYLAVRVAVSIFLWSLLFIIPGIIWAIRYSMTPYIFVAEGLRGKEAMEKSHDYVKGHAWDLFVRLVVILLLYLVLFIPVSIVTHEEGWVYDLYTAVLSFVLVPFILAYEFAIYQDLKRVFEARMPQMPPVPPVAPSENNNVQQ